VTDRKIGKVVYKGWVRAGTKVEKNGKNGGAGETEWRD